MARDLPPLPATDVALDDLVRLLVHPAKGFLRQRLQISLSERDGDPDDALPVGLDALEQWAVGDRMLRDRLAGLDPQQVVTLERGRGILPPGPLGGTVLRTLGPRVDALAAAAGPLLTLDPDAVDVGIDLGDGTELSGTVGDVRGDSLVTVVYSSLGPKHRLSAWVRLLALSVARPLEQWRAVTLGRGTGRDRDACARSVLGPVPPALARTLLLQLVALYRAGLQAPLPLPCKTGEAYAAQREKSRRVTSARFPARKEWDDGNLVPGEQSDAEHVLLAGGSPRSFEELLRERAGAADLADGWPGDEEGDRFGVLARRLWGPLLAHEERETL